jgi:hypothetical protein
MLLRLLFQVYQVCSGRFLCRNKYYGRSLLGVDGFREAICHFLHNGHRLRNDALIPLVEKLEELKAVLATMDSFRFYTSSLLLVYEGLDPEYTPEEEEEEEECSDSKSEEDVSMNSMDIDDDCSPEEDSGSGLTSSSKIKKLDSVIIGPTSFLGIIPSSKSEDEICGRGGNRHQNKQKHQQNPGLDGLRGHNAYYSMDCPTVGGSSAEGNCSVGSKLNKSNKSISSLSSLSSEYVDVRMIDFAHATHSGLESNNSASHQTHSGPDAGYIFGLSNLINVLREIIKDQKMEF